MNPVALLKRKIREHDVRLVQTYLNQDYDEIMRRLRFQIVVDLMIIVSTVSLLTIYLIVTA